jgi:hypothetical protein
MSGTTPVKPSEFRALVPDVNDSVCTVLRKFFKFMRLFWLFYRWKYVYNTGELSDDYADMVCDAIAECKKDPVTGA